MNNKELASSLVARATELDRAMAQVDNRMPEAEIRMADAGHALVSTLYDAADRLTDTEAVKALHGLCGHYNATARKCSLGWPPNKAGQVRAGRKEVAFDRNRQLADYREAAHELIEAARVYADRLRSGRTW